MTDEEYYQVDEDGWTVIGSHWVNLKTGQITPMTDYINSVADEREKEELNEEEL